MHKYFVYFSLKKKYKSGLKVFRNCLKQNVSLCADMFYVYVLKIVM